MSHHYRGGFGTAEGPEMSDQPVTERELEHAYAQLREAEEQVDETEALLRDMRAERDRLREQVEMQYAELVKRGEMVARLWDDADKWHHCRGCDGHDIDLGDQR